MVTHQVNLIGKSTFIDYDNINPNHVCKHCFDYESEAQSAPVLGLINSLQNI